MSQDLAALSSALAEAKTAYKADKTKAKKAAYKAAKQALAAAQAAAEAAKKNKKKKKKRKRESEKTESVQESVVKKPKAETKESLQAVLDTAKAAYKADKSNAALKKAYKTAKKALAAFSAAPSAPMETEETKEETKEEETKEEADPMATLNALNKKPAAAAPTHNHNENPPNPGVFCGNLSWSIDEDTIKDFFKGCGEITDVHWLTDKESGDFLGRGFVTFDCTESATKALEKDGMDCAGRPIRLGYSRPRTRGKSGGGGNNGKRFVEKPLSERPDNCTTAFVGNVSFEIDDDTVYEFAKDCGEIVSIRWLTDRETGDFKGCGFVEFAAPEGVDEFVKLRGQQVMGRPIRIDYSAPRNR